MSQFEFFATCPKGLESLLYSELESLGAENVKETVGGVKFGGAMECAYRACLWSRLANKILLNLGVFRVDDVEQMYRAVSGIDWLDHLDVNSGFRVDFHGLSRFVRHSHFGALKVKDAIVDQFMQGQGRRPSVVRDNPDVVINAHLNKGQLSIYIDLSGESLHRRGYRLDGGLAPLKENLAAAILMRAEWPAIAARGGALLDPMCGSGTLLIEAALMAADVAPGLARTRWGFDGWQGHVPVVWNRLQAEAEQRRSEGLAKGLPEIRGYDASLVALRAAEENIERAGMANWVRVSRRKLREFTVPTHRQVDAGLVVTNPPYGERLGEVEALKSLYQHFGERLRSEFAGWQCAMITGNPELGKTMGIRSTKQYQLRNGNIASKLLLFTVLPEYFVINRPHASLTDQTKPQDLSEGAQMFANRLRKNRKALSKWVLQNQVACYRLYDADIPEYAVAVDWYDGHVHVSEYAPPKTVDSAAAEQRLADVMAAIPQVLDVPRERIALKTRQRQRGTEQYLRLDDQQRFVEVREGNARLLVNLFDYLDTGLFLDHRPVRLDIAERAKGLRFLNLFCYTASATVQAAVAGARYSVSVDMSKTYLRWASKNLALNGFSEATHRLVQANCLEWLVDRKNQQEFDLILLDPPTFSNSKRMEGSFDVQRDHILLVDGAMSLLAPGGLLIFSNNYRRFGLAEEIAERYRVEDVSLATIDRDFARNSSIHRCWHIRHK